MVVGTVVVTIVVVVLGGTVVVGTVVVIIVVVVLGGIVVVIITSYVHQGSVAQGGQGLRIPLPESSRNILAGNLCPAILQKIHDILNNSRFKG